MSKSEKRIKKIACAFAFYLESNYEWHDSTTKGMLYMDKDSIEIMTIQDIYDRWVILMGFSK